MAFDLRDMERDRFCHRRSGRTAGRTPSRNGVLVKGNLRLQQYILYSIIQYSINTPLRANRTRTRLLNNCNRRLPITRTPFRGGVRPAVRPERSVTDSVTLGVRQNKSIYLSMGGVKTCFWTFQSELRSFSMVSRPGEAFQGLKNSHRSPEILSRCHAPLSRSCHKGISKQNVHKGISKQNVHKGISKQNVHKGISKQNVHKGISKQNVYKGISKENVHKGISKQNVHKGISQQNVHKGFSKQHFHKGIVKHTFQIVVDVLDI